MLDLKYVSLLALVFQTTAVIIVMRFSRIHSGDTPYLNTVAVLMSEIFKLVACIGIVIFESGSVRRGMLEINTVIVKQPVETFLVGVPAILYSVQNNLLFVAMTNLSGAVYQVSYQLKVLTTALLSVIFLKKSINLSKWSSLFLLFCGVAVIQFPTGDDKDPKHGGNIYTGILSVLFACFTSAFAGVWFEKILKESKVSIWMRNIQLALYGVVVGAITVFTADGTLVAQGGLFQGFTVWTWGVIVLQALGGLAVAAVLKYADNILKCFAFAVGTGFVLTATYTYSFGFTLEPLRNSFLPNSNRQYMPVTVHSIPTPETIGASSVAIEVSDKDTV